MVSVVRERLQNCSGGFAQHERSKKDGKHASGGMMIAVKKETAPVVDTLGGKVEGLEEFEAVFYRYGEHCKVVLRIFVIRFLAFGRNGRHGTRRYWKQ